MEVGGEGAWILFLTLHNSIRVSHYTGWTVLSLISAPHIESLLQGCRHVIFTAHGRIQLCCVRTLFPGVRLCSWLELGVSIA